MVDEPTQTPEPNTDGGQQPPMDCPETPRAKSIDLLLIPNKHLTVPMVEELLKQSKEGADEQMLGAVNNILRRHFQTLITESPGLLNSIIRGANEAENHNDAYGTGLALGLYVGYALGVLNPPKMEDFAALENEGKILISEREAGQHEGGCGDPNCINCAMRNALANRPRRKKEPKEKKAKTQVQ